MPNDSSSATAQCLALAVPSHGLCQVWAVRCSAWLGMAVIPNWVIPTVLAIALALFVSLRPWKKMPTEDAEWKRAEWVMWLAVAVTVLFAPHSLGLIRSRWEIEREKATRERMEAQLLRQIHITQRPTSETPAPPPSSPPRE